jgi:hypothetical protein
MSQTPHREPDPVDASSQTIVPRQSQHPAVHARGRSVDIHRASVDGQRTFVLSRNPSIDSNSSIVNGHRLVSNKTFRVAGGSTLSTPGRRSNSLDAPPVRPTSVNHNLQPVPIQHSQRSGMPHTLMSNSPATGQHLLPIPQHRPETPHSFVGPAGTVPS